jgi:hypothetical protein
MFANIPTVHRGFTDAFLLFAKYNKKSKKERANEVHHNMFVLRPDVGGVRRGGLERRFIPAHRH